MDQDRDWRPQRLHRPFHRGRGAIWPALARAASCVSSAHAKQAVQRVEAAVRAALLINIKEDIP